MQSISSVIEVKNLKKSYKGFHLDIPELKIPKGFATALIGENGAGKTTLLSMMAGLRLNYKGEIWYFEEYDNQDLMKEECPWKEWIGYTGPGSYYLPHWNSKQIGEISEILYDNFHKDRFEKWCKELCIENSHKKKVSQLSDGNRMKLIIAGVLARDTKCLLMDEPASPLDPLMRDKLCELIREYLEEGNGEKSVFFSTHNISDMENVTDYAIIMEHGQIVEQGFVEDLKEKYVIVRGEAEDSAFAKDILVSMSKSNFGFEGLCLAENLDKFAGMDVKCEVPTLSQISVGVMKANSKLMM